MEDFNNNIVEKENTEEMAEAPQETGRKRWSWLSFIVGAALSFALLTALLRFALPVSFISNDQLAYYKELDSAYGKYNEILRLIGEDPIAQYTPQEISDDDIKKLIASIGDPYAEYYTPEEYEEFKKTFLGNYVGIGIIVAQIEDQIVIKGVFEDGPAAEAGIEVEDVIVEVDGKKPADVNDAVSMITGEAGTSVKIRVNRGGEDKEFTVTRAVIEEDSVAYDVYDKDKGIGYIRITSFIKGTNKDFKLAVKELKNKGCDKFIIDLRDNGGGLTDVSIDIADYLLPACRIMTETYKDGTEKVYSSDASSAGIKCAVLVNGNTASASEILTGALQDNNAATVIGSKTFGKGVTQMTHGFSDGSVVKLTVSEYFRPNGETVNGKGITPDVEADPTKTDIMEIAEEELGQ